MFTYFATKIYNVFAHGQFENINMIISMVPDDFEFLIDLINPILSNVRGRRDTVVIIFAKLCQHP